MDKAKVRVEARVRIQKRIRRKVAGTAERPRLAVSRSLRYISVQLIDDAAGATLAHASSREETVKGTVPRVGRNEPCPCGSGKKYKHCHGKLV